MLEAQYNFGSMGHIEMNWVSLESIISDLSNDTALITIDPTDPELYGFTLLKSLDAYNSGSMVPIEMK